MEPRDAALNFLTSHKAGVLATVGSDGKPHASAIYYVADNDFNIYFLTLFGTRKFQAMKANPAVAFTVGAQDVPQTIQMEGTAMELQHDDDKRRHIEELMKVLTANPNYYAPIARLDQSEVVMMWVKPTWVRWGDYTAPQGGSENVLHEIVL